ncbi:MAG: acetoin catabolism protein X, partial [Bradyrhizobium sp.]|nr:acetoin catabolism protein X [Bradyrhizobium sp.]
IAPGLVEAVGIDHWRRMPAGVVLAPTLASGSVALDGEREMSFTERDELAISLVDDAFLTVDVAAVMKFSAIHGLMRQTHDRYTESLT